MASPQFTFGAELELADVDTRIKLPEGNQWDKRDYTIANSSGICNDPLKELIIYGGEINTRPTDSVEEQVQEILKIYKCLGQTKALNYTTNLHIHVGVPGLKDDLKMLKQAANYIYQHQKDIFSITEKLEKPREIEYASIEAYSGALKRYARRKISHQKMLDKNVFARMLSAATPQEFYEAHAPRSANGKLNWQFAVRCGINLMQLFNETDTIEFRHFTGTFDETELRSCLTWCREIAKAMTQNLSPPSAILQENPWMRFPQFYKYNHEMDKIFQLTSVGKLPRPEVKANIERLLAEGIITHTQLGI